MRNRVALYLSVSLSALLVCSVFCGAQNHSLKLMDVNLASTSGVMVNAICSSKVMNVRRSDIKVGGGRIYGPVTAFGTTWSINIETSGKQDSIPVTFMTSDPSQDVLTRTVDGLTAIYGAPTKSSSHDAVWISESYFIHVRPLSEGGWLIVF